LEEEQRNKFTEKTKLETLELKNKLLKE